MPVRMSDNLTNFTFRLPFNLGASTSWSSQGLSRPLKGLLYPTLSNSNHAVCLVLWRLRFADPK
jgi:hypothetical protein